jgi:thiol-disulfide isomerase/thioredoxin
MSVVSRRVYNTLSVSEFKQILAVIDAPDQKSNVAIILKFGATWCGPCKNIKQLCAARFNELSTKITCFDLDIDEENNNELYSAYASKKMVTSIPTILAYVSNPERNVAHWWAPDLSVNSSKSEDVELFFKKINSLTK